MTYDEDKMTALVSVARLAGLHAPAEFWATPPSELIKVCNGIGADWQSAATRAIITKAVGYAEAAAVIHDWRYSKPEMDWQREADEEFLMNGLKLVRFKFKHWWDFRRWLGERAVLAMYAVLERLGFVAYKLGKESK